MKKPGPQSDSLTRKAALTNANGLLEQCCRLISGMVISPFVMRTLGTELYGAWSMIGQIQSYLSLSDFRSAGTLKILLSVQQHQDNPQEKRRLVGASIVVWFLSLALLVVVATAVLPFSSALIKTKMENTGAVRMALGIAFFTLAATQLFSIAGCSLRGSNLDYTAMGWRSLINLLVSLLGLVAVKCGLSLVGLASAACLGAIITGLFWLYLARKFVPWFGAAKPSRTELKSFAGNTGWTLLSSLGQALLTASDVILIGYFISPSAAGMYSSTGALNRFLTLPMLTLLSSASIGLNGISGRREWPRLTQVSRELMVLSVALVTVSSVITIMLNASFVQRWAGAAFFAGPSITIGVTALIGAQFLYRFASILLDGLLEFKSKAYILLTAGLLTIGLSGLAVRPFGAIGVLLATGISVLLASGWMFWIFHERTGLGCGDLFKGVGRPCLVGALLIAGACWLKVHLTTWAGLAVASVVAASTSGLVMLYFGLDQPSREKVISRLTAALRR